MDNEKHFTPPPGVKVGAYTAAHDRVYRVFLLLMPLGILGAAVAELVSDAGLRLAGVAIWDIGVLGASYMIMVWDQRVKRVIMGSALAGVLLQAVALTSPILFVLGAGVTAMGAAGIAMKEDYCFHIWQGRALPGAYAVVVLVFLMEQLVRVPDLAKVALLFLAYLSVAFTWRKLRLPLVVVKSNAD